MEIWLYARYHDCVIVTFDADFYDISILYEHPPKIIWIRLGNSTTKEIAQILIDNLESIANFIEIDEYKDTACLEID